jgi:hypothetical protein
MVGDVADVLQTLVDGRATVDLQDANGRSALMLAAEVGNGAAALFLLEHGADVHLLSHCQDGELNHASMGMSETVARRFLHSVTELPTNPVDSFMRQARRQDAEAARVEKELERLAQEAEEEEDDQQGFGMWGTDSVRQEAQSFEDFVQWTISAEPSDSEDEDDDPACVGMLPGGTFISKVAPLRPKEMAKPSPDPSLRNAWIAQSENLRGVVRRLAGAGDSALTIAARGGHADVCELLLHFGADSHIADGNGETALGVAARCGHVEACQVLLTRHPTPQAHAAALQAAEQSSSEAVARMLRGYYVGNLQAKATRETFQALSR